MTTIEYAKNGLYKVATFDTDEECEAFIKDEELEYNTNFDGETGNEYRYTA